MLNFSRRIPNFPDACAVERSATAKNSVFQPETTTRSDSTPTSSRSEVMPVPMDVEMQEKMAGDPQNYQGVHRNTRFMHAATALMGCPVRVVTKDAKEYEGIFRCFSEEFQVALECAHEIVADGAGDDCATVPLADSILDKIIFKCDQIVTLTTTTDLDAVTKNANFATDTEISRSNNGEMAEKELEVWEPDDELNHHDIESSAGGGRGGGWSVEEMFHKNEQLGVGTSFKEDMTQYTNIEAIAPGDPGYEEAHRYASEVAATIEKNPAYKTAIELENDDEEKDIVDRKMSVESPPSANAPGKYIAPQRKRNDRNDRGNYRGGRNSGPGGNPRGDYSGPGRGRNANNYNDQMQQQHPVGPEPIVSPGFQQRNRFNQPQLPQQQDVRQNPQMVQSYPRDHIANNSNSPGSNTNEWERVPARGDFRGSHNSGGDHIRPQQQFGGGPNRRNFNSRGPRDQTNELRNFNKQFVLTDTTTTVGSSGQQQFSGQKTPVSPSANSSSTTGTTPRINSSASPTDSEKSNEVPAGAYVKPTPPHHPTKLSVSSPPGVSRDGPPDGQFNRPTTLAQEGHSVDIPPPPQANHQQQQQPQIPPQQHYNNNSYAGSASKNLHNQQSHGGSHRSGGNQQHHNATGSPQQQQMGGGMGNRDMSHGGKHSGNNPNYQSNTGPHRPHEKNRNQSVGHQNVPAMPPIHQPPIVQQHSEPPQFPSSPNVQPPSVQPVTPHGTEPPHSEGELSDTAKKSRLNPDAKEFTPSFSKMPTTPQLPLQQPPAVTPMSVPPVYPNSGVRSPGVVPINQQGGVIPVMYSNPGMYTQMATPIQNVVPSTGGYYVGASPIVASQMAGMAGPGYVAANPGMIQQSQGVVMMNAGPPPQQSQPSGGGVNGNNGGVQTNSQNKQFNNRGRPPVSNNANQNQNVAVAAAAAATGPPLMAQGQYPTLPYYTVYPASPGMTQQMNAYGQHQPMIRFVNPQYVVPHAGGDVQHQQQMFVQNAPLMQNASMANVQQQQNQQQQMMASGPNHTGGQNGGNQQRISQTPPTQQSTQNQPGQQQQQQQMAHPHPSVTPTSPYPYALNMAAPQQFFIQQAGVPPYVSIGHIPQHLQHHYAPMGQGAVQPIYTNQYGAMAQADYTQYAQQSQQQQQQQQPPQQQGGGNNHGNN